MRTVQLAKIAAEAELVRLRRVAKRTGSRAGYAVVAAVFGLAALAMVLAAVTVLIAGSLGLAPALWIMAVACLAIAGILAWLAARSTPDVLEVEARMVRDSAIRGMRQTTSGTAVATDLARKLLPFVSMWLFRRK